MDSRCEKWIKAFKEAEIHHQVHNKGYHIQCGDWNFYPTKKSYYNQKTHQKGYWSNIKDVKKILGSKIVTKERVFDDIAQEMMVRWDLVEFKKQNPVLIKVIKQSMEQWASIIN